MALKTEITLEEVSMCEICGVELHPGEQVLQIGDMTVCSEHDGENK